ncbi:MAG: SDR family oxidoreductase [Planctomycetota bacterium]|nr:SDR family oxidoreductase [Planctomycetota bacterium]
MSERTALITGGAKGIGRAIGLALAEDGWSVACCYRESAEAGAKTAEDLRAKGAKALVTRCDVSDPEACESFVGEVRSQLGGIDALIHCAGPYHRVPLLDESIEGWHAMFDNNLHPVFYLSRLVGPEMMERGWGRIITFSMANADRMVAQPQVTAHYIAKSGVLILTRTLAKVLGKKGVTVNAISPGFIDSGSAPAEELEKMVKNIPAGYVGELSDAVSATRFLLSDEARYVNGANLQLSGGWGI